MEPKLNLIFTKALLKDRQNLDWVGVGPEASIGKVMAKANLLKVSVEFPIPWVLFRLLDNHL